MIPLTWVIPDDWTGEQAFAVADFLISLHDAIWDRYGSVIYTDMEEIDPHRGLQLDLPLSEPDGEIPF